MGMQGKFSGVQPAPGLEKQRADKKERGIATDVTPQGLLIFSPTRARYWAH